MILQRDLCICEIEADLRVTCWSYITIFVPATVGTRSLAKALANRDNVGNEKSPIGTSAPRL